MRMDEVTKRVSNGEVYTTAFEWEDTVKQIWKGKAKVRKDVKSRKYIAMFGEEHVGTYSETENKGYIFKISAEWQKEQDRLYIQKQQEIQQQANKTAAEIEQNNQTGRSTLDSLRASLRQKDK